MQDQITLIIVTAGNHLPVGPISRERAQELILSWEEAVRQEKQPTVYFGDDANSLRVWSIRFPKIIGMYISISYGNTAQKELIEKSMKLVDRELRDLDTGEGWKGEGQ